MYRIQKKYFSRVKNAPVFNPNKYTSRTSCLLPIIIIIIIITTIIITIGDVELLTELGGYQNNRMGSVGREVGRYTYDVI
jgi:hypothetical protein